MRLTFIGMSGIGKSFWTAKLRDELGFVKFACDDEIFTALQKSGSTFSSASDEASTHPLAQWMKNPYDAGYRDRAREYLQIEKEVTLRGLDLVTSSSGDAVLDTTGSVIYLDSTILSALKTKTTIVLLEHSAADIELLYQTFLHCPKPLIWGDAYRPRDGETKQESLARSFRELLQFRDIQYRALAEVVVPMEIHRNIKNSAKDLVDFISKLSSSARR